MQPVSFVFLSPIALSYIFLPVFVRKEIQFQKQRKLSKFSHCQTDSR